METSNCTIVGQKGRGDSTYATKAQYVGYASGGTYYDYTLSFNTGDFNGASTSITFNIKMSNSSQGNPRTYRWALLSSDANVMGSSNNLYRNTAKAVTDENQLAQGTVTWNDVNKDTHKVLTIETVELKPNTNYFLVLWAYSTSPTSLLTVSAVEHHGDIIIEYDPLAETYVYININGVAMKRKVYVNSNGNAVKRDVYFNYNGTAVKR